MANREYYINILRSLEHVLRENFGVLRLVIYGSVARNEQTAGSDLDICVDTETPNPFMLMDIKDYIARNVGCEVDIIRRHKNMNPYLESQILKDGIRII